MIVGKNPLLLNVSYIYPNKSQGTEEAFEVIYKSDDGVVRKLYEPPLADIYFVKPEYRDFNYNKPWEKMERLFKARVPISKIKTAIANESIINPILILFTFKLQRLLNKVLDLPLKLLLLHLLLKQILFCNLDEVPQPCWNYNLIFLHHYYFPNISPL